MYIFKKQIVGSNLFAKTNLWFTIGFILTAALTFSEVARGRQYNFMIFSDATRDFWNGIIPYGAAWAEEKGHDVFLFAFMACAFCVELNEFYALFYFYIYITG